MPVARHHLGRDASAPSPSSSITRGSIAGATYAKVPTAPDSLPTAIWPKASLEAGEVAVGLEGELVMKAKNIVRLFSDGGDVTGSRWRPSSRSAT